MDKIQTHQKLNLFLEQLKKKCIRELSRAGKDVVQENVKVSLPKVTGSFAKTYHNTRSTAKLNQDVLIGYFTKETADILERGINSYYYKALGYPKFVKFEDEPHLKQWLLTKKTISKAFREEALRNGGVFIGKPKTTRFGVGQNKWFTIAMRKFRPSFRKRGLEYLRRIEMNKNYRV